MKETQSTFALRFNFVGIEGDRIMGEVGCRLLERKTHIAYTQLAAWVMVNCEWLMKIWIAKINKYDANIAKFPHCASA
jgi:hypothetical protein